MFPRFSSKSDENHASPMENLARHQKLFFHNFPKPRATSAMNDAVVRRSYWSLILTTSQQQQYCWPDWKCLFLAYNQVFYSSLIFSFLEKKLMDSAKRSYGFMNLKKTILKTASSVLLIVNTRYICTYQLYYIQQYQDLQISGGPGNNHSSIRSPGPYFGFRSPRPSNKRMTSFIFSTVIHSLAENVSCYKMEWFLVTPPLILYPSCWRKQ